MKWSWNSSFRYHALHPMAFVLVGAGVVAAFMFTGKNVSAGQADGRPATQAASSEAGSDTSSLHPEFPAGEGREAVMQLCVKCHSPNIILAYGQNRTGWENTITKMARLGAKGSDEDFSDIADYLTANFPPSAVQRIFVNMATDKQIAAVLEISVDDAKTIISYRDKIKGFKSIEELKSVPNVDVKKIDAKKDRLIFGAGSTATTTPAS